ncbi:MAG: hypothetical protein KGZ81_12310 [Flavobacteriales bacterium]|nr:hypothetical protein [Flavobacteriales bacterium]
MHYQAEKYNSELLNLQSLINDWRSDADAYELKIEQAAKEGKPVAGMETYHTKQLQKINRIESFASAAHTFISAMQSHINLMKVNSLEHQYNTKLSTNRTRICDLPDGPNTMHLEVMETLTEILYRMDKKTIY